MKVPARFITIVPVEGYTDQPGPFTLAGPTAWASARGVLALMARYNDLSPDTLGVHKTDFVIEWANGQEYRGTFGLAYADHDLAAHVLGYLTHHRDTLREHPRLEKTYGTTAQEVDDYLDTYQIGDVVPVS